MRKSENGVEAEEEDDKERERPGGMHLDWVAELDLEGGFDEKEEGSIVE